MHSRAVRVVLVALAVASAFVECAAPLPHSSSSATHRVDEAQPTTHENAVFDVFTVSRASSTILQNCTVGTLVVSDSTAGLRLLAVDSTIGQVESTSVFFGKATFVRCDIGSPHTRFAVSFSRGTAASSNVTIVETNVTASQAGGSFGDINGHMIISHVRVTVEGSRATHGLAFNTFVFGVVSIARSVVHSTSSSVGTTAVFFNILQGSVHIDNTSLTAFSNADGSGNAAGLMLHTVKSPGCLYVTGGAIVAHSSEYTTGNVYGVNLGASGGSVTFADGASITTTAFFASYGIAVRFMTERATLLVRDVEITSLAHVPRAIVTVRALNVVDISEGSRVVLESTTMHAAKGACLHLDSRRPTRSGILDIRGLHLAECNRIIADEWSNSSVKILQNCLTLPGPQGKTEAPIGYAPATTVFPCVDNKPRSTWIDVSPPADAAIDSCAAFGSVDPFRIRVTTALRGNVTRSHQYLGILTIEDPELVSLVNVEAYEIKFTKSSSRLPTVTRITISSSTIYSGGVQLAAAAFSNIGLTIEGTTIASPTPDPDGSSTLPLLNLYAVEQGSVTVRDSTITGRRLFDVSTVEDANITFQNTTFTATPCTSASRCGTSEGQHIALGSLFRSSFTVTDCRVLKTAASAASTTVFRFDYLGAASVSITDLAVSIRGPGPSRIFDVRDYRGSCITISNSTVIQSCSQDLNSSSSTCVQSEPSYFFHSGKAPTQSSYLTLDNVSITMATYSATAVYLPYLQNIDVVMSRVNAQLTLQDASSSFFHGINAKKAVVALLDSTVTLTEGTAYRFTEVDDAASLLTLRSTLAAPVLASLGSGLNSRQGCGTVTSNLRQSFGLRPLSCEDGPVTPCGPTPFVYKALGISDTKAFATDGGHQASESRETMWLLIGLLGGSSFVVCCVALSSFAVIHYRSSLKGKEDQDHNGREMASVSNNGNPFSDIRRARLDEWHRDLDSQIASTIPARRFSDQSAQEPDLTHDGFSDDDSDRDRPTEAVPHPPSSASSHIIGLSTPQWSQMSVSTDRPPHHGRRGRTHNNAGAASSVSGLSQATFPAVTIPPVTISPGPPPS